MYAVLETGGKQYRVTTGDKVEIERLDVETGKVIEFVDPELEEATREIYDELCKHKGKTTKPQ